MTLKNLLLGWLLIGGMILYAVVLTVIHAGRTVYNLVESDGDGDTRSVSSP